jgi:hypothetical protein
MKRASNLHRILNLSSKITKPQVDLTRGFDKGTPVKVSLQFRIVSQEAVNEVVIRLNSTPLIL